MNNVVLIGNISTDLELKQTMNGKSVCQFNLAINGYGEKTDFVPVQVWNKQAENLVKFQQKGSKIGVVGRISVDNYEQDGQKKTFTKVIAHEVEFLGSKPQEKTIAEVRYERKNATNENQLTNANNFGITDNDFPF